MITHIKDPNSDRCIVFIHGLGGGPKTFNKFSEYLNSSWKLDYGVLIYCFTYYKNIFNSKFLSIIPNFIFFFLKAIWSKRNLENSLKLKEYIENNCVEDNNIFLVAHSMGGLVARQYLVDCKKNNIDIRKIRMLCTFATPHNGSAIARKFSIIDKIPLLNKLYKRLSNKLNYRLSPQIGDLSNLSEFLDQLNNDWRDFNIERDLKFIRIGGAKDRLVKEDSFKLHNDDLHNVFYYEYNHSGIISPVKDVKTFDPIDKFIEKLNQIEIEEEYFEEFDEDLDYEENDSEITPY
jgi:triacylglycerol esterase/lipase EstA (alpha/beta hydrolase family)